MKRLLLTLATFSFLFYYFQLSEKKDTPQQFSAQPLSPATAPLPRTFSPEPSDARFQKLTQKTWQSLPRISELRHLGKTSSHDTPAEIMATVPAMAEIQTQIASHPEFVSQGMQFYEMCAKEGDIPTSLRVGCLRQLKYWAASTPGTSLFSSEYPENIWRLSETVLANRFPSPSGGR
jgi:hypothetical protein